MAVQSGLCRTLSETPKTGFLRTRLIYEQCQEKTCNSVFEYAKTKAQISCAVTMQLISVFFSIHRKYNPSTSLIQNFKLLAIFKFCDCPARFVSDLVGNPEDLFSHEATHNVDAVSTHSSKKANKGWYCAFIN